MPQMKKWSSKSIETKLDSFEFVIPWSALVCTKGLRHKPDASAVNGSEWGFLPESDTQ